MLKAFWSKWMRDERGHYTGAYHEFQNANTFETVLEKHVRQWLAERRHARASWTAGSPYRGLEVFEEEHQQIFFGRDRVVAEIRARLTAAKSQPGRVAFLLVLGSSGSGKSSLIRAGFVPELTLRNRVPGVDGWRRCIVRPSELDEPLFAVARALFNEIPQMQEGDYSEPEELVSHVWRALPHEAARPVLRALDRWGRTRFPALEDRLPITNLLFVIDQLEELFDWDDSRQAEFIRLIGSFAKSWRIWVVATLRNDFYQQFAANPELQILKERGTQYDLPHLGEIELADIIRRPAEAAGLNFEIAEDGRRLDDIIFDAARTQRDSLPLLEFALEQLYRERNIARRELTLAAYNAMGGLVGAIASRAESLLQQLHSSGPIDSVAETELLSRVFNKLATVSEDGKVTSRPTLLREFEEDAEEMTLIKAFEQARLFVMDQRTTMAGSEPIVRVAHDALLQQWPRVARWVNANTAFLLWRTRLEPIVAAWKRLAEQGKVSSSALLRGDLLAEAERWRDEMRPLLTNEEAQFIELSTAARIREEQAEREAQRAVQEAYRRATRQLSRFLTAAATRDLESSPIRSLLLGVEALKLSGTEETERVLRELLAKITGRWFASHRRRIQSLAFHPNGRILASASEDGSICLWDTGDVTRPFRILRHDSRPMLAVAFNHDGSLLAWGSTDEQVHIHRTGPNCELEFYSSFRVPTNSIDAVAFDSTGRFLAAGGVNHGTVFLADLAQPKHRIHRIPVQYLDDDSSSITSLAFASGGRYLASGSDDKKVRLWDLTNVTAKPQVLKGHTGSVRGVAFDSDGSHLVSVGANGIVLMWEVFNLGKAPRSLTGHRGTVHSVAFQPKGRMLATTGDDKTVRLWNLTSEAHYVYRGHEQAVVRLAFDPEGQRIASGSWMV